MDVLRSMYAEEALSAATDVGANESPEPAPTPDTTLTQEPHPVQSSSEAPQPAAQQTPAVETTRDENSIDDDTRTLEKLMRHYEKLKLFNITAAWAEKSAATFFLLHAPSASEALVEAKARAANNPRCHVAEVCIRKIGNQLVDFKPGDTVLRGQRPQKWVLLQVRHEKNGRRTRASAVIAKVSDISSPDRVVERTPLETITLESPRVGEPVPGIFSDPETQEFVQALLLNFMSGESATSAQKDSADSPAMNATTRRIRAASKAASTTPSDKRKRKSRASRVKKPQTRSGSHLVKKAQQQVRSGSEDVDATIDAEDSDLEAGDVEERPRKLHKRESDQAMEGVSMIGEDLASGSLSGPSSAQGTTQAALAASQQMGLGAVQPPPQIGNQAQTPAPSQIGSQRPTTTPPSLPGQAIAVLAAPPATQASSLATYASWQAHLAQQQQQAAPIPPNQPMPGAGAQQSTFLHVAMLQEMEAERQRQQHQDRMANLWRMHFFMGGNAPGAFFANGSSQ